MTDTLFLIIFIAPAVLSLISLGLTGINFWLTRSQLTYFGDILEGLETSLSSERLATPSSVADFQTELFDYLEQNEPETESAQSLNDFLSTTHDTTHSEAGNAVAEDSCTNS